MNVLYPRRYQGREGDQVQWLEVGVAWQTSKGVDVKLWVTPPADGEGNIRVFLREPKEEQQGSGDWQPSRPRHHDRGFSRPTSGGSYQGRSNRGQQYGGAAAEQAPEPEADQGGAEDNIPF